MFFQNNENLNEEIAYISKMFFNLFKIPIYFLNSNNELIFSFENEHCNNPIANNNENFVKLFTNINSKLPVIKSTIYLENYISVNLIKGDVFLGKFIVGPTIFYNATEETINKLLLANKIQMHYKIDLVKFYSSLKVIDFTNLVNIGGLLYYCIYNSMLEPLIIIENNSSIINLEKQINTQNNKVLSSNRENTVFHHSITYEKNIFESIRQGDKKSLLYYINSDPQGEPGVLSSNPLRSKKNLEICIITLATRAAIDGGLEPELAYSLSDSYIQALDITENINDLEYLKVKALCDFTDKVNKIKEFKYPKAIYLCQNYISKHLYENITLSEVAEALGLNKKYLSSLFSKTLNITLTQYVQMQKIKEAKFLLASTNYSILNICELLKFHDQSHFTKVFKKFVGITPKKFIG